MKKIIMCLLVLLGPTVAFAALVETQVSYAQDGTKMEGYLVYDDVKGDVKRPGVLVIHEWMGLNDYAKSRARQLAELGYVAMAADIYGVGVRPNTVEEASKVSGMYKSNRPLLRQRVIKALDVLKQFSLVKEDQVAAIGYCFGGTTVLELARSGEALKGVVSFHGGLSKGNGDKQSINTKILVLHGEADPFVPPLEVKEFKQEMDELKADYQFIAYPGAVHGFTNPMNKGAIPGALYNKEADEESWEAMKTFLSQILL